MTALAEIEGIGAVYQQKLGDAGVSSIEALLKRGATPAGRKEVAAASGVSDALVLEWVNHADLFRVKGIGAEYADLLEAAGVDSVPELAHRNADNLAETIVKVNEAKRLVRRPPSAAHVKTWVAEAKSLPRGRLALSDAPHPAARVRAGRPSARRARGHDRTLAWPPTSCCRR